MCCVYMYSGMNSFNQAIVCPVENCVRWFDQNAHQAGA